MCLPSLNCQFEYLEKYLFPCTVKVHLLVCSDNAGKEKNIHTVFLVRDETGSQAITLTKHKTVYRNENNFHTFNSLICFIRKLFSS